jgi:transcriptional regulator with XRE-family HTH domain
MMARDEVPEKKRLALGAEVRMRRKTKGWSRDDLFVEVRKRGGTIGSNEITRIEQGKVWPRADTLEQVAAALETSVAELTGSPSPSVPKPAGLLAVVVDLLLILERLIHALPDEAHVARLKGWMRDRPAVSN